MLEQMRKEIDRMDVEILHILAARFKIADEIGRLKIQSGQELVQPDRWKLALEERFKQAKSLSLDYEFVSELFTLVHNESIRRQSKNL